MHVIASHIIVEVHVLSVQIQLQQIRESRLNYDLADSSGRV